MAPNQTPGGGRLVALLLVAALVALAGCGGASPSGSPSPDAADDAPTDAPDADDGAGNGDTVTPSPSPTPTPTATPTATATSTPASTATATEAGAFATYRRNLRSASSYTVEYTIETSDNQSGRLTGTVRADLDRETLYQRLEVSGEESNSSFEYYRPPGADVVYTRLESGGRASYRKQNANDSQLSVFSDPVSAVQRGSAAEAPDFRDAGTVSTDDGPRRAFVVDSVEQLPAATRERYAEIRSVSWEMLVDEDRGYVTDISYELTFVRQEGGDERTVAFELSYRDVGSTTVEDPGWLDEAKEQTDG
jgi:predicted small lipoprotein YifL